MPVNFYAAARIWRAKSKTAFAKRSESALGLCRPLPRVTKPFFTLRQRALNLLARREHSRAELARKLARDGTEEEIAALLDELSRAGLLSDQRFAESWTHRRGTRFGAARLRHDLRTKGISDELIDQQLAALPDELERARAVWQKKFTAPPQDSREWARQARFLAQRGFAHATIRRLLREPQEDASQEVAL